jgi:porin
MTRKYISILAILLLGTAAMGQTTTAPAASDSGSGGNWTEWSKMTGDWGGARTALADKGITLDFGITNVVQENMHGGASTNGAIKYSGLGDLQLTLDTGKLTNGAWPGGTIIVHGEPKWGNGVNKDVGSLFPVNIEPVKLGTQQSCLMALSEYFLQQVLFDGKLVLLAGQLDGSRAFDTNEFANDEHRQFMNLAFRNYVGIVPMIPYTTMGVGVVVNPTDWWSLRTAVVDADGKATISGFESSLHGEANTSVMHEWDFTVKPFGQVGHQRVAFVWSSKDTPNLGNPQETNPDNIAILYNFDQYLYTNPDDSKQGIGLFGRFGWSQRFANAIEYFYSFGTGGKGLIPTRAKDTYGLGWYFASVSDQLPMSQENGIEMYYNIEIFPWLHVSPDFQIICQPGGQMHANDTALVGGIRCQMDL